MNTTLVMRASTGLASPTSSTATPLIGGSTAYPTYPVSVKSLCTGFTTVFVPDMTGRYFYFVDGSGNLLKWDSTIPTVPPAIIVTQSTIGSTIVALQISPDGTKLYAATTGHKIITILTSSPYTVAVLAGSGTSASTNGTGTAASFTVLCSMCIDPLAGAFLLAWEGDTGNLRKIITATGVVTTTNVGIGPATAGQGMALDKGGNLYICVVTALYKFVVGGSGAVFQSFSGSWTGPICVSTSSPTGQYLYMFADTVGGGASLIRIATATTTQVNGIAIAPNAVNTSTEATGQMHFRFSGIYFVDHIGILCNVLG